MKKTMWRAVTIAGLTALAGFAETLTVVSDEQVKYYYANATPESYPVAPAAIPGIPAGWNTPGVFDDSHWHQAAYCSVSGWLDPAAVGSPFQSTNAKWISTSAMCGTDDGTAPDFGAEFGSGRGVYLYRIPVTLPGAAVNITGSALLGADNFGFVYLNGTKILQSANLDQGGNNFASPASASFPVSSASCQNVIGVEIQNGGAPGYINGSTGAIFAVKFSYDKPAVAWNSPAPNEQMKGGNLQIKFDLTVNGTASKSAAYIGVIISGPGVNIAVAPSDVSFKGGSYSVRLPFRDYAFQSGVTYTASVVDGCNLSVLGSQLFTVK